MFKNRPQTSKYSNKLNKKDHQTNPNTVYGELKLSEKLSNEGAVLK